MTKAAELAKMGEVLTNSQIGGRRNIIINGAMICSQRASSTTTGVNAGYHTLDRFFTSGNSAIGQYTISQSTDAPNGFSNSYKIDVTTADTSLAAGDHFGVSTNIEAQNLYQVGKGTSDAQPLTLSFYVKSNVQKQFVVELTDSGNSRHINFQKTVSATDTWERMIINIPADTSGSFGTGGAKGSELNFWLGAGTTYTSGSIQNTWASRSAANIMAGVANIADSTSNEFFLTGVQLEVGNYPNGTPFEHRSFGDELLLCQRYYEKQGAGPDQTVANFNFKSMPVKMANTTQYIQGHQFAVAKRVDPTIVIYSRNATSGKVSAFATGADEGNNWATNAQGQTGFHAVVRDGGTHTANVGFEYGFSADA